MTVFVLFLLCIVQGLTEFLPVSSSGHLLLIEQIFGIESNFLLLNLFLHLATLFAVLYIYRKTVLDLIKRPLQPLTYKLILSTIITALIAYAYKTLNINAYVFSLYGPCFVFTSIVLFVASKYQKNAVIFKQKEVSTKCALVVGIVQGFAVLPGISRSGSTISSLILMGNDEKEASKFSFLLSIPIILGGFVVECFEVPSWNTVFLETNLFVLAIAFVVTFLTAIISLKMTLKMLKAKRFDYFALYLLIVGICVSIYNFAFK